MGVKQPGDPSPPPRIANIPNGVGFVDTLARGLLRRYPEPEALAAFRAGVDGPRGARLETVVEQLRAAGWEVVGESLKTAPRGFPRDHPRIGLLRRRSLAAMRWIEDGDVVTTPLLVDEVRADWRRLRPLVEWLREVVGDGP